MKTVLSIQSNVVYGYAGNKVATLAMQLQGVEVMPIHTVQLSSNTVYPHYDGIVLGAQQITRIVNSLEKIGVLSSIDAIISGYIGLAEQGEEILEAVKKIKFYNPNAIYVCDPVMGGDINKGSSLPQNIIDFFTKQAIKYADYITPNLLELQILSNLEIKTFNDVLNAIKTLQNKPIQAILVKNLLHAGKTTELFEMILATPSQSYHLARPLYDFPHRPLGVGDLICSLFTAHLVNGQSQLTAFELAANAANHVLDITKQQNARELAIIDAQQWIKQPDLKYRGESLGLFR
ncbi:MULTISPECIES: pyridoxal kinase PdxY [unclassified Gilliamella]|uniref:pyridoxal kinase PdxY n=1 Tax=unclassified Gilliamella TaxID=2685620 RepID=UPI00226A8F9A|nr:MULTISPECIES: pyridoxal kinase PdxY [unclassified Gilliamella]MCX8601714.1 pyridoxal kinase PdxY [Gilliamella sp. B3722]MCX8608372.1 pyridoxal kinase PdxY [Gilliamella sp. B3771]MCX8610977.1 pyridoxal kinase PdxY [Gilliamella sp. B3891]MCX8613445.1 pyridoxal kinase PdxY [Gilliamella sp. B3773]MCX8616359.1 pyridoxal kinase PdxY [Gilliamella sp. B3770]